MKTLTRLTLSACAVLGASAGLALAAAPAATTTAATAVTATTATLNGTVSPNNTDTTYYFEYGTSTTYGTKTATQGPIQGNANKSVSADVTALAPSTAYHYRVVAVNADGTVPGADATFTTPAPGAPAPALSIATSNRTVTFGRPTTISGTLTGSTTAGVTVTLEGSTTPTSGSFKSTGLTAVTDATGKYSIVVSPAQTTQYRVTSGDKKATVTSPAVTVRVRVKVTLSLGDTTPTRGQRVLFSGTVLPAHDGAVARIQRRTASGAWRTVASTTLVTATPVGATPRSKYAKRVRITKSGTYRVRVAPADGDHIAGSSSRKSVVVS
ncbi:MAG: hypothetical protein ACJ762_17990 [Solirubrobacteraceae bacterium]